MSFATFLSLLMIIIGVLAIVFLKSFQIKRKDLSFWLDLIITFGKAIMTIGVGMIMLVALRPFLERYLSRSLTFPTFLKSVDPSIADQIQKYIVEADFLYENATTEGFFYLLKNNKDCLEGRIIETYTVVNLSKKTNAFPLSWSVRSETRLCDGIIAASIKVLTETGKIILDVDEKNMEAATQRIGNTWFYRTNLQFNPGQKLIVTREQMVRVSKFDRYLQQFRYPTVNASVSFVLPDDIEIDSRFQHPAVGDRNVCMKDPAGTNPYHVTIRGGILPYQGIEVIWQPKK